MSKTEFFRKKSFKKRKKDTQQKQDILLAKQSVTHDPSLIRDTFSACVSLLLCDRDLLRKRRKLESSQLQPMKISIHLFLSVCVFVSLSQLVRKDL